MKLKNKKPRVDKTILYNKRTSGYITIPNLKLYYKVRAIKTTWHWHKNRQVEQWNLCEDPNVNPNTCGHLAFDKNGRIIR